MWTLVAGLAGAQTAPDPRTPGVTEAGPELYYLHDDAGRLVPVPGFRYRDFIELLKLREGVPAQPEPPAAVLEAVAITATIPATKGAAVASERFCEADVRITVRQVRSGWVSVPLDLQGLLIASAPVHDGPGEMIFASDSVGRDRGTVRLWFNAAVEGGDVRHVVTLQAGIPVESSSVSDTLTLVVPAATASRIDVRSFRTDPIVTVRPSSTPPLVEPMRDENASGSGSVVTVVGVAGSVEVRIGDRGAEAVPADAVPETMVESIVRIDGTTAHIDATLRFDNLPASVDTVTIALPARATLGRIRDPSMLVRRAGTAEAPLAIVLIDRDPNGRAVVDIECEQAVDASGRTTFDPLGFAVSDIPQWRQRGRMSIVIDGEWQVEWADLGANRRIDPPLAARRPGFVAAFAYDAQPAALPLRVRARGSRVVIEPEYRYDVGATRISLDARLRVGVRGSPVSRLVIGLDGWEVDDVGPIGLVDATAVTSDSGRIVIPFQHPLAADAVIDIRCSRSIDRGSDRVNWTFPAPEASLVGPAAVLVSSDSDIELVPDADGLRGLVRQVASIPLRSDVDRFALTYRLDSADGAFAAQRRFLERRIDASIRAQIDIDQSRTSVAETIRFVVAHVPLESVELLVPETIASGDTLEIRQGRQLLNPAIEPIVEDGLDVEEIVPAVRRPGIGGDGAEPGSSDSVELLPIRWARVRAMLPVPLLGAGEVSVAYRWPTPSVPAETTVAEDLPLVMPVEAKVGRQSLQVNVVDAVSVDLRGETWKRDAAAPAAGAARSWIATGHQNLVPLVLAARRQEVVGETIVEATWLQTRLSGDRRHDIWTYAISTAADRLAITLPIDGQTGADAGPGTAVEVWLDGRRVDEPVRPDGNVVVNLPPGDARAASLVEFRISRPRFADSDGSSGLRRLVLEPPTFPQGTQQRRFYWEIQLPSDEHVIVPASGWTAQQRWGWSAFGMERQPVVSRDALAAWVRHCAGMSDDGMDDAMAPGFVGRRSVYSSVGSPATAAVWVAPTWLVVFVVSGPVLALGLVAVFMPPSLAAPLVVALATLLTALAAVVPDMAPLALQAALPGVGLSVLAAVMRGVVAPRRTLPAWSIHERSVPNRTAPPPSIIVSPSAMRTGESVTTAGRPAS
ncbi:MAG: hypothetical protein ACKOYJ_02005 [Planctomycetia bacterium]